MGQDYQHFIVGEELEAVLNNPDLVIVDCRFDLKGPDWGYQAFLNSHIPGAQYAHLDHDLSSKVTAQTGRHPLPTPGQFNGVLSRLGIGKTSQVVAYDDQGGAYAARLWWLLRYFGHRKAALLDGGYTKWLKENRPLISGNPLNPLVESTPQLTPNHSMVVETSDILNNIQTGRFLLVDARAPQRFRGELEPIDTAAGHIPGAINRFHGENLNPDMTIKTKEQLTIEFNQLLGAVDPQDVVIYCGSGVTSCLHIAAMEYAGIAGVRLYPGSWSEWIRDASRPIIVG